MAVRQQLPDLVRALKLTQSKPIAGSNGRLPSLRRAFSLYDQINLIDNVPQDLLRFQWYTETGFKVNGVSYEGSLFCVGNLLMSWSPTKLSEVTPDRLLINLSNCPAHTRDFNYRLREANRTNKSRPMTIHTLYQHEVRSSQHLSTYNILSEEGRIVAAALIPYGVSLPCPIPV